MEVSDNVLISYYFKKNIILIYLKNSSYLIYAVKFKFTCVSKLSLPFIIKFGAKTLFINSKLNYSKISLMKLIVPQDILNINENVATSTI